MARVIVVQPSTEGWEVDDGAGGVHGFATGSAAELEARRMLEQLAQNGVTVELRIYLRDGALAGRFISSAGAREAA